MIDRVVRAVEPFGPLIVVGGPHVDGARYVKGGEKFIESLTKGLGAADSDAVLVVTADVPFLTSDAVRDFVGRCDPTADFCYPIVRAEACRREFPGLPRTTLKIREGEFTGGNLALVRKTFMARSMPRVEAAYAARKSPLRLASMLGWRLLARILWSKLVPAAVTLASLERAVGEWLGAKVQAVPVDFAGIGSDVDSIQHYLALKGLRKPARKTDKRV
jgi:hypothetical protein